MLEHVIGVSLFYNNEEISPLRKGRFSYSTNFDRRYSQETAEKDCTYWHLKYVTLKSDRIPSAELTHFPLSDTTRQRSHATLALFHKKSK
jgi:hypothetical protein